MGMRQDANTRQQILAATKVLSMLFPQNEEQFIAEVVRTLMAGLTPINQTHRA